MVGIHIDANIFLDFYQSATDRLGVFAELQDRAERIVMTEQAVSEFRRNRIERLSHTAKVIDDAGSTPVHTTAAIRELPEFKILAEARETSKKASKDVASHLRRWVEDESSDPVLSAFERLMSASTVLPTTDQGFERAHRRKLLGEPPTSPDKHSIGDELIWETLLESWDHDLVFVTRDKGFLRFGPVLRREYEKKGNRKLLAVTDKLKDALTVVGAPSERIASEEQIVEESRSGATFISSACENCGLYPMRQSRVDWDDGEYEISLVCPKCYYQEVIEHSR